MQNFEVAQICKNREIYSTLFLKNDRIKDLANRFLIVQNVYHDFSEV